MDEEHKKMSQELIEMRDALLEEIEWQMRKAVLFSMKEQNVSQENTDRLMLVGDAVIKICAREAAILLLEQELDHRGAV